VYAHSNNKEASLKEKSVYKLTCSFYVSTTKKLTYKTRKEHVSLVNYFITRITFQRDEPHNENAAKHLFSCLNDGYKGAEQSIKPMGKQELKRYIS